MADDQQRGGDSEPSLNVRKWSNNDVDHLITTMCAPDGNKSSSLINLEAALNNCSTRLRRTAAKHHAKKAVDRVMIRVATRHQRKINLLRKEYTMLYGTENNPNRLITNLTGDTLTADQEKVLRFGLKYCLATRLKEADLVSSVEQVWEQLYREDLLPSGYMTQEKVKHSLRAMTYNLLDFDNKRLKTDNKHIQILRDLKLKYVIMKPDKGNGVVLMKKNNYYECMFDIFCDKSKFRKLKSDPSYTQVTTLRRYLNTLQRRGELSEQEVRSMKPQNGHAARAYGLPKIHKEFELLPPIRPVVDNIGSAYYSVGKYLSSLLNPLTESNLKLRDSFDAVDKIRAMPTEWFQNGYCLVSFDVVSLFTNVPLKKTINIILDRICKEKIVTTNLSKRSLKKLLTDCCTKTPISCESNIYQQIDGVIMGSPLGPVMADIIMIELEKAIVTTPLESGIIKSYLRYFDDTLLVIKPENIEYVKSRLNSFHEQIQFTHETFVQNNSANFLDVKIENGNTTIFRKSTHTGLYVHFNSFEPWFRKIAWIRALIQRARKICSTSSLFETELAKIKKFVEWNGFPRHVSRAVLQKFRCQYPNDQTTSENNTENVCKIYLRLPYAGKQGEKIVNKFIKKVKRLLLKNVKFVIVYDCKKISSFVSYKDFVPVKLKSFVVYEYVCPGCGANYIGKTERCLQARLEEPARGNSEIHAHVLECPGFQYIADLHMLPESVHSKPSSFVLTADMLLTCISVRDNAKN